MSHIDSVDLTILNILQQNGRTTNVELSRLAGLSAPPCLRRLKHLEDSGVIKGYYAEIDSNVIGYRFRCICLVSLCTRSQKDVASFVEHIDKIPNVRSCSATTGDFDFVLQIVAKDINDYEKLLNDSLSSFENIANIKTYILMNYHKNEKGIPII